MFLRLEKLCVLCNGTRMSGDSICCCHTLKAINNFYDIDTAVWKF